jgi:acetyl-CoA/propionyl-CoA carboxylase biotin carboxyl carrier protein
MADARTVLVANRGEIAIRIIRTARRMGMRTVAVYSEADEGSPHVRAADVAVPIGPAPATESYLRRDVIIETARATGAELVHPGYGFLAEDDRFAKDCEDAALIFVGPPSHVLRAVGDKAASRALAHEAGVPVLPGYAGEEQSDGALRTNAERIGFPLIVKPAGGGGGKGMSVVREIAELDDAIDSARRLAAAAFGDDRLILERYIEGPRHVEVQVMADAHGNVIHLGERDCSLQRRHQKILEESPAPNLADEVRGALHEAAVAFARRASYVGAGTCEFLVAPVGTFGFIEMNARLQVEHPVTEAVTGLDLVELQLRVALGETLPLSQDTVVADSHAIEVRVYAEDPASGFVPQAGRVELVRWPATARVDTWIEDGTEVSSFYDPLLGKVIVHAPDQAVALSALDEALSDTVILGPRTNVSFLRDVIADEAVQRGTVTTDMLDSGDPSRFGARGEVPDAAFLGAAAAEAQRIAPASNDPFVTLGSWRTGGAVPMRVVLRTSDTDERVVAVDPDATVPAAWTGERWLVWADGDQHEIAVGPAPRAHTAGPARLDSPLPGRVVAVHVSPDEDVVAGADLVVIEAMKMEHAIKAPADGVVRSVLCRAGDQVERGQALVDFEPAT